MRQGIVHRRGSGDCGQTTPTIGWKGVDADLAGIPAATVRQRPGDHLIMEEGDKTEASLPLSTASQTFTSKGQSSSQALLFPSSFSFPQKYSANRSPSASLGLYRWL